MVEYRKLTFNALAVNLTTAGIPCIYYGTEQGFDSGGQPSASDKVCGTARWRALRPHGARSCGYCGLCRRAFSTSSMSGGGTLQTGVPVCVHRPIVRIVRF
jgi:glycosidase